MHELATSLNQLSADSSLMREQMGEMRAQMRELLEAMALMRQNS